MSQKRARLMTISPPNTSALASATAITSTSTITITSRTRHRTGNFGANYWGVGVEA